MRAGGDLTRRQARWALIALIILFTAVFGALACLKSARMNCYAYDAAECSYGFRHSLEGRWFPALSTSGNLLGYHANMLLLLWWPIYRLLPHINTLFFLQSFTTSLAAWPVYLLARGKSVGRVTALLAGAGLLLFPPIARVPLAEIHNEAFPLAPLLLAFYFFEKKSLGGFTGFLALALLGKDTVVLSTVCFSLYALIRRRDWRWVAFPAVWSILYFVAIHRLAIPLWGDWWAQKLYGQTFFLRNWGRSPSEVALAMAQSPGRILQTAFSGDNLGYLARLLLPLGVVLPFGSWAWLTAIPGLAVNLLGACPYLRTFTHWYSTLVGAQLWASLVLALPYWNRRLAG